MVPKIGIPALSWNLAMTGSHVADQLPKVSQRGDISWESTRGSNDGDGLLLVGFGHYELCLIS